MAEHILLVVDYQNDFVDGALGFEKAAELDQAIAAEIKKAYDKGCFILFTMDTHDSRYLSTQEGQKLPVPHCIKPENGWELYGEVRKVYESIQKDKKVIRVEKPTFGSMTLAQVLQNCQETAGAVKTITICGVVTNMCVISNAVIAKAALPESEIVIDASLCASFVPELHDKALDVMESMQMKIINR